MSLGLMMMVLATILTPMADTFAKLAVAHIPAIEVTAFRFIIQVLAVAPFLYYLGSFGNLSWESTKLNMARGFFNTMSMIAFVASLKFMAVADAIAIFFAEPLILTVLGAVILKERVGPHRISACIAGLVGTLIVIQPSFAEFGWYAVLPLVCAFCVACNVLVSRVHSQHENPWAMQFQSGIWGLLFCAIPMLIGTSLGWSDFSFVPPQGLTLVWVFACGLITALCGLLGIYAARVVPASTLAPIQYFEIFSATLISWLVFNHFPDAMKWLGIAIIIASGLYIIWRERRNGSSTVTRTTDDVAPLAP